jgi:hypothetical protein
MHSAVAPVVAVVVVAAVAVDADVAAVEVQVALSPPVMMRTLIPILRKARRTSR